MSGLYTEADYENSVVELFRNDLGYEYAYGPDTPRDFYSPLYEEVLIDSLYRLNRGLPDDAIQDALFKLKNFENGELVQKNAVFMDYLQNGIPVRYFVSDEERSSIVYLVDYKNPDNNSFIVANQWTFIENSNKRPDIILFLNGLPVVLVELKSPSREETDASEAYRQLRNYMIEIPSMFIYNAICVMSDQLTSKAGTITSGEDRFMEWKTKDGNYENTQYAQFDTVFEGMFQKERLLDIIKNFICFSNEGVNSFKILAGYHQYFAVRKAIESTKHATVTDGKGGVFWHTQGSGKSLSMVFYAHLLQDALDTEGLITSDELKEILELCISYVLRRAVCEIPTNSMNKTFATLKNYIKPDDYLNSVKAFFVMQDTYKEFPDNDKFEGAFVNRDIYNMRARNYILSRLENFENKAPIIIENYTIEHIMPQNKNLSLEWQSDLGTEWQEVQKKYLHTIGNLTLTAYNSEMSDRPFLEKMDMPGGFKESALRLNKYVVLQNKWNEKHIQERANELAKKAEYIWPYPTLTVAELAPYQVEDKTVQKYSLETYDVNAFTRILFESLDKRIMNLSPAVKKEYKKLYVAYKLDTNFVDIVFQKQRLRISINMKFSEINDPNGICKDITGLGRWGNGDVELFMEHQDELDQIMEIVKQSFDAQAE